MNSLETTDAASAAVQKTPHRVALADIEAAIAEEHYGTGAEAVGGLCHPSLEVLTICLVVMKNGFTVIGKSAPADPRNFDEALGRQFAREDAIRQIWPLMGFSLRDRLMAEGAGS